MTQALYFLKDSSGYIKIGRSTNFPKRLSEIRRGTTDEYINVLAAFYSDAETNAKRERELHKLLESDNFKGEWFHDKPAFEIDRQFYFADSYPGFARYELKPVTASIPEARVQLPDDDPVAGSESVQIAERWNGSQLYKRNLVGEQHGQLTVETFIGVSVWNDEKAKALAERIGALVLLDKANLYAELISAIKQNSPPGAVSGI
jgi:hypothetical protein